MTGMELLPVGTLTRLTHFVSLLLYFIWISVLTESEAAVVPRNRYLVLERSTVSFSLSSAHLDNRGFTF